ncbi:hypothetical protein SAMN05444406_10357 [Caldicoprobacter faecalis]|uniref:Uncharacterized protein n=1 Tax=Caldicoprobacter faecalis TaxID=937334 RepID=A0A1I5SU05_9FIRM|nr:hypothetical protein SAMN05444406_10357 [Caldicoprobacter faecalis]
MEKETLNFVFLIFMVCCGNSVPNNLEKYMVCSDFRYYTSIYKMVFRLQTK